MRAAISPKPEKATRQVRFAYRRNQPGLNQTKRVKSYIFCFTGRWFYTAASTKKNPNRFTVGIFLSLPHARRGRPRTQTPSRQLLFHGRQAITLAAIFL